MLIRVRAADPLTLLACLLLALCPIQAGFITFEDVPATLRPGPPLVQVEAYTTVDDSSIPPQYRFELESDSPACLGAAVGCYLGSFVFQPPKLNIPATSTILFTSMLWWVSYAVEESLETSVTAIDPTQPATPTRGADSTYFATLHFVNAFGEDIYYQSFEGEGLSGDVFYSEEMVRAALLSDSLLPPMVVDVHYTRWRQSLGGIEPGLNSITTYTSTFELADRDSGFNFAIEFESTPIPEPSNSVLALSSVAGLVLVRVWLRRRQRSRACGLKRRGSGLVF